MEERIPLKREKSNLRGNPEIDEGDEEDSGKNSRIEEERVDKERQPLFASVPSWLSPVGGGSVQRALDCGPTSVGFGVDAIEKQGHC